MTYPPVAQGFLDLFGCGPADVVWEDMAAGLFGLVVPAQSGVKIAPVSGIHDIPHTTTMVQEVPTNLQIPVIAPQDRSIDPPDCLHGKPTQRRVVFRKDSANVGRAYFVCAQNGGAGGKCSFFRWGDETDQYSKTQMRPTMTAADVHNALSIGCVRARCIHNTRHGT